VDTKNNIPTSLASPANTDPFPHGTDIQYLVDLKWGSGEDACCTSLTMFLIRPYEESPLTHSQVGFLFAEHWNKVHPTHHDKIPCLDSRPEHAIHQLWEDDNRTFYKFCDAMAPYGWEANPRQELPLGGYYYVENIDGFISNKPDSVMGFDSGMCWQFRNQILPDTHKVPGFHFNEHSED